MGLSPKDPEGRTAWDYGAGLWRELYAIREALTESSEESLTRFLTVTPEAAMDGVALEAQASVLVPAGSRWEALGFSAYTGVAATARVRMFRNVPTGSGFLSQQFANGGYVSMANLPDNVVLEENTRVIFTFVFDAAPAIGTWPLATLVCRQVNYGHPPMATREGGEDLMGYNFTPGDPDLEREDQAEYQETTR